MRNQQVLFSKFDWFSIDRQQRAELATEIGQLDGDRLLNTSLEDLCDYFEKKYRVEVPVLRQDEIVADQHETQMEIRDYERTLHVKGTTVELISENDKGTTLAGTYMRAAKPTKTHCPEQIQLMNSFHYIGLARDACEP